MIRYLYLKDLKNGHREIFHPCPGEKIRFFTSMYRVDKKYATASVNYQNKKFFGNPFYEFRL